MFDYALLIADALLGVFAARIDWRRLRRPWCGLAMAALFAAGYAIIWNMPVHWVKSVWFLVAAYIVVGSAAALVGYLVGGCFFVIARQVARLRR